MKFSIHFLSFYMVLKVGSSFQVLGETIHISSEYVNTIKEKAKVLSDDLRVKR